MVKNRGTFENLKYIWNQLYGGEEQEDRLEEEMMRPGRLNLLNVMNYAQTQQCTATFQKETQFCDFQHMNEQCIEVQCPDLTYLSKDFVVCWTAKCPISSLLVSFLTALALHLPRWNHCSLAVSFIPDFGSPFIQWPGCLLKSHILFIPGIHLIIQARIVSATSFISIPFMGLGAAGFGTRTYYWFLRCVLLVQHLSNLSRVTLPFIGRHLSQIHARQAFIADFSIKPIIFSW